MFASPVLASHCLPREIWVEHLKDKYGEQLVEFGLIGDGRLMERFATPNGATWTLLVTDTSGISCGFAAGETWQKAAPELLKPMGLPI